LASSSRSASTRTWWWGSWPHLRGRARPLEHRAHRAGADAGTGALAGALSAVFSGAAVVAMRALRNDTDASTIFSPSASSASSSAALRPPGWRRWSGAAAAGARGGAGLGGRADDLHLCMGYVTAAAGGLTTQLTPPSPGRWARCCWASPWRPSRWWAPVSAWGACCGGTGLAPACSFRLLGRRDRARFFPSPGGHFGSLFRRQGETGKSILHRLPFSCSPGALTRHGG
jgi:hypothetical protein